MQENLQHWLTNEKVRDQFVIRSGSDTEILWNDATQVKDDPVYKRPVHRQGPAVWGDASTFNRLMRYAHPQVVYGHAFLFLDDLFVCFLSSLLCAILKFCCLL